MASTKSGRVVADDASALIGPRLRELRHARGLTLQELGARTSLTHAFLSQVERGLASPSLRTLLRIASALGVALQDLVGLPPAANAAPRLTRSTERASVVAGEGGARVTPLTGVGNSVQAVLAEGGFPETEVGGHPGEELVFVLSGRLAITVAGERYELGEEDSLVFDGRLPHAYETLADDTRMLVVVVHPDEMPRAGGRPGPGNETDGDAAPQS